MATTTGALSSLQSSSYLSLTMKEIDPVRDLNNYLQEIKKPENLTQYLSFSSQQTGQKDKAVHTGTYTCQ